VSVTLFIELDIDCMDLETAKVIDFLCSKDIPDNTEAYVERWGWNDGPISAHTGSIDTMNDTYDFALPEVK